MHMHVLCQATFLSSSAVPWTGTQAEKASLYACTSSDTSQGQGVPAQRSWSRAGTEGTIGAFLPSHMLIPAQEASAARLGLGDLLRPQPGQRDSPSLGLWLGPCREGSGAGLCSLGMGCSHHRHGQGDQAVRGTPVDVSQKCKVPLSILHQSCCSTGHHLSPSKSFGELWGVILL